MSAHRPHSASLRLEAGEVHLWLARTDFPDASLARLELPLSPAERERVARYRFDADRRRFVVAHGLLRALLGGYLGCAPQEVSIGAGAHGKPYIDGWATESGVHFNTSHSGDWFAAAVALQPVGVDVEVIPPRHASGQLAEIVLATGERADFARLPESERGPAVYSIWTRKEAVLKARGVGLREPMHSISVSVSREAPPRVTAFADGSDDPEEWLLHDFEPAPGVAGTLALRARVALVRSWLLEPDAVRVWPIEGMRG